MAGGGEWGLSSSAWASRSAQSKQRPGIGWPLPLQMKHLRHFNSNEQEPLVASSLVQGGAQRAIGALAGPTVGYVGMYGCCKPSTRLKRNRQ